MNYYEGYQLFKIAIELRTVLIIIILVKLASVFFIFFVFLKLIILVFCLIVLWYWKMFIILRIIIIIMHMKKKMIMKSLSLPKHGMRLLKWICCDIERNKSYKLGPCKIDNYYFETLRNPTKSYEHETEQ